MPCEQKSWTRQQAEMKFIEVFYVLLDRMILFDVFC